MGRDLNPLLCDEMVSGKRKYQCSEKRGDDKEYPEKCLTHAREAKLRDATGVNFFHVRNGLWSTAAIDPLLDVIDSQTAVWTKATGVASRDFSEAKKYDILRALIQLRAEGYTLIPPRS
jgi:hypothetical protein